MKRLMWCVLLSGCFDAEKLDPGSLLERTRVLAVVAHPGGDPARAWPRPGEETSVEWLVAAPHVMPALHWTLSACVAHDGACTAPAFLETEGTGQPSVSLVTPQAEELLLIGTLEPEGEPATVLTFRLPVESAEVNHHPGMGTPALAGEAWPEGEGCQRTVAASRQIVVGAVQCIVSSGVRHVRSRLLDH